MDLEQTADNLPIEELGDFLHNQFGDDSPSAWAGFSLGYSDENNSEKKLHSPLPITLSPFLSPKFPSLDLDNFQVDATAQELSSFSIAASPMHTTSYDISSTAALHMQTPMYVKFIF